MRDFYGGLFGWNFRGWPPGSRDYFLARKNGSDVAGLVTASSDVRAGWRVYFATTDITDRVRRIRACGGEVKRDPVSHGALGTMVAVTDPEGAEFALWQADTHPGFGMVKEPGAFAWFEVRVTDTAGADAFYASVFEHAVAGADPGLQVWAPAGSELGPNSVLGGRRQLPEGEPAHYEVFFTVDNCDNATRQAVDLGGTVLQPPMDTPLGRIAEIADPEGMGFAVVSDD